MGLAEGIIDDTCLVSYVYLHFLFNKQLNAYL